MTGVIYIVLVFFSLNHLTGEFTGNTHYTYVVAQDGSGDFESIQAAIDASKAFPKERVTIFVKKGRYSEKVTIPSWNPRLSLIGEDADSTIITWGDHFNGINRGRNSTFHTATLRIDANDVELVNFTIENSAGPVGQAVALHIEGDRVSVWRCKLIGDQDTLYVAGEGHRQYFKDCYIEGTTDFIFGEATAFFEGCEIKSKKDSYITAASTPEGAEYGMVFSDCILTAEDGVKKVYLGRPWREYARTVFIGSELGEHILPEGWHNWGKEEAEGTSYYAEFENTGPGAITEKRVNWSHQLTQAEAKRITKEQVFKDWKPVLLKEKEN